MSKLIVDEEEYRRLREDSRLVQCMKAHDVQDWPGFEESLDDFEEWLKSGDLDSEIDSMETYDEIPF